MNECVWLTAIYMYYIFRITFLTTDLNISTICCIICVPAGASLVYSVVHSVCMRVYSVRFKFLFRFYVYSCVYLEHNFYNNNNKRTVIDGGFITLLSGYVYTRFMAFPK